MPCVPMADAPRTIGAGVSRPAGSVAYRADPRPSAFASYSAREHRRSVRPRDLGRRPRAPNRRRASGLRVDPHGVGEVTVERNISIRCAPAETGSCRGAPPSTTRHSTRASQLALWKNGIVSRRSAWRPTGTTTSSRRIVRVPSSVWAPARNRRSSGCPTTSDYELDRTPPGGEARHTARRRPCEPPPRMAHGDAHALRHRDEARHRGVSHRDRTSVERGSGISEEDLEVPVLRQLRQGLDEEHQSFRRELEPVEKLSIEREHDRKIRPPTHRWPTPDTPCRGSTRRVPTTSVPRRLPIHAERHAGFGTPDGRTSVGRTPARATRRGTCRHRGPVPRSTWCQTVGSDSNPCRMYGDSADAPRCACGSTWLRAAAYAPDDVRGQRRIGGRLPASETLRPHGSTAKQSGKMLVGERLGSSATRLRSRQWSGRHRHSAHPRPSRHGPPNRPRRVRASSMPATPTRSPPRRRSRIGPLVVDGSTTRPCCVTSISPTAVRRRAGLRVRSISGRYAVSSAPPAAFAASEGRWLLPRRGRRAGRGSPARANDPDR